MSKNYLKVFLVPAFAVSFLIFGAFHYASANFISDLFGGGNSAAVSGSSNSSPLRVYGLRVYKSGNGTVASDDGKINCGSKCSQSYSQDATVNLTASPASGFTFIGWSTGWFDKTCPGTGSCSLTMNKSKYARAYFRNNKSASVTQNSQTSGGNINMKDGGNNSDTSTIRYEIAVKKSGIGSVKSVPEGINCVSGQNNKDKNVCEYAFPQGQVVVLYASPDVGSNYEFGVWGGDCRNTPKNSPCRLTVNKDKKATVSFDLKQTGGNSYKISVIKTGNGNGKVESRDYKGDNDGMILCGADCSERVKSTCQSDEYSTLKCTSVHLKATANEGSTFISWGGDCDDKGLKSAKDECVVNMNSNKEVTALFNENVSNQTGMNYKLTIQKPVGGTVVNRSGNGRIDCGTLTNTCSSNYGQNTTVNLEALTDNDYVFSNWTGCDNQSGPKCVVNMNKNRNIGAFFKKVSTSSSSRSSSSSVSSGIPTVQTIDASNITTNSATLNGMVDPKDKTSKVSFEIFPDPNGGSYGMLTPSQSVSNSSGYQSFSYNILNLKQGTTYTYYARVTYYDPLTGTNKTIKDTVGKTVTTAMGSSSSSSSNFSSNIELKVREVLTGGRMGAYADEITLNNPNSEGTESADLKWTVPSDASNCSLVYSFNAKPLQWGQLISSEIIAESGKTRETGNYRKHGTEDYVVNFQNKSTATYTLSCRSGGKTLIDTVNVNF